VRDDVRDDVIWKEAGVIRGRMRMDRWRVAWLTCVVLFALCALCAAREPLKLATGSTQGTYYAFGLAIKRAVEREAPDLRVEVMPTRGSAVNAELIREGHADFALMQSDVADECAREHRKIRGVASLYDEAVHIVALRREGVREADDLRGHKIGVGPKGSGTAVNAQRILNALQIYRTVSPRVPSAVAAIPGLLESGALQAAFFTTGVPSPAIARLGKDAMLVGLRPRIIESLLTDCPYFVPVTIPAGSYPGQYEAVRTLGVRALLVARRALDPDLVERVLQIILADDDVRKLAVRQGGSLALAEAAAKGMSVPLHDGARDYYESRRLWFAIVVGWVPYIVLIILIFACCAFLFKSRLRLCRIVRRSIYCKLAVGFVLFYVTATVFMHFFERARNPDFESLAKSFWSTAVYVLSGIEEKEPHTVGGRWCSVVLMFVVGLGLLGTVAGNVASIFMKREDVTMPADAESHIVICNWNRRGDALLSELHSEEAQAARRHTHTAVITNVDIDVDALRKRKKKIYQNVCFIRSDASFPDVLKSARVPQAWSVIILADETAPDPDAKTALIALAIKQLCPDLDKHKPHVVCETLKHETVEHMRFAGAHEVICAADYGLGVLAQSALQWGLSEAYENLLKYSDNTNEVYIIQAPEIPEAIRHKATFAEVAAVLNSNRRRDPVILLGFRRNGKVLLNPHGTAEQIGAEHRPDDDLVVMAFHKPNLQKLAEEAEG